MNVLFYPPTHGSGLGMQFRETVDALRARGVGVSIGRSETGDGRLETRDWILETGSFAKPDLSHLFDAPDWAVSLDSLIKARAVGKPIVVNPIYWNSDRFYAEGLPAADPPSGENAELEQHLRDALRSAERAAQRVIFRHAAVLIAMSQGEADLLARDFDVARERICVATDGIDPQFARGTSDAFVNKYGVRDFVLCAARIEIRKNQWNLIRALRDEPVTVVLAGETLAPGYRALCKQAAQGGRVRVLFVDALGPDMLASAYAAARVHVLASWFDCAPFSPLEAAAAGCAIAMSTESGARNYFRDDAHYFDPANLDEMRKAVKNALDAPPNPALRERLLRECTWERCAEQTIAAYQRALELGNPTDSDGYRADLEAALTASVAYNRLQEHARAELWREKAELANARDAYANGRVMRLMARVQGKMKR